MSLGLFETLSVLSFLVMLAVNIRMVGAIRLLSGRVDLLSDQFRQSAVLKGARLRSPAEPSQEGLPDGEKTTHVVDDPELEALLASMDLEHGRIKKKMGRDFQMVHPTAPRKPAAAKPSFADEHDPLRRLKKK